MKIVLCFFACLLLLLPPMAEAQSTAPAADKPPDAPHADNARPAIVRVEKVHVENGIKTVVVGNSNVHYLLTCDVNSAGCVTPEAGGNYLLFDKDTHWKMPGENEVFTLAFVQSWTVTYKEAENIGLIPEQGVATNKFGLYRVEKAGYYGQNTISSDGPILYGTGMKGADQAKAWENFFMQMAGACEQQQGADALQSKLVRRCVSGKESCVMTLDAKLNGTGGTQDPKKVVLMVATDAHDDKKLLSRTVCIESEKDTRVCRDWDTGQLTNPDDK